ncbi:MAG: SDR family oxidoreductase, partial [Gammaproteobacteria bacterium]|nr:SDR family oxidoreductase [Gammaproteobacteria bacterium]
MNYFITGGTGFIGHNLISELLRKKKKVHIYVL